VAEPLWLRHDLPVLAFAALVLAGGWSLRTSSAGPATRPVTLAGVSLAVPAAWIVDGAAGVARGEDAVTRVEVRTEEPPPAPVTLDAALELLRGRRYGSLYQRTGMATTADGWLRTTYAYAFKPSPTHAPRLASAVEYARAAGDKVYVVTLHASTHERARALEPVVFAHVGLP
jgi:hypothetical protein